MTVSELYRAVEPLDARATERKRDFGGAMWVYRVMVEKDGTHFRLVDEIFTKTWAAVVQRIGSLEKDQVDLRDGYTVPPSQFFKVVRMVFDDRFWK